jgi:hypothetical protein
MPRLPIDYSKAVIYKLCCKDPTITDVYVGSTTDFTRRKRGHKDRCNNENGVSYNLKVYQTIRDNGGWVNWDMVEIEKYEATDRNDLHKRERHFIEELGATLNCHIPSRTGEEWRQDNKEQLLEKRKQYYKDNKEKHKLYCQENKKEIRKYNKEKRQKNIQEKRYYCSLCDKAYRDKHTLTTHFKTIKHNKKMNDKIQALDRFLYTK